VPAVAAEVPPARQAELLRLLTQDCGSCHGLTLRGGLGPALTREALAGKSADMLRAVILHGRPGTPMPPWRPFMNEAEAAWLVKHLQAGVAADAR
jgi:cytochrome c55X